MATTTQTTTTTPPPTRFTLTSLPPFPEDVPTAPLLRLSLHKLLSGDKDELQRFFRACEDIGFFYLDLTSPQSTADAAAPFVGERLLRDADKLFALGRELFELPVEEKTKYDFAHKNSYFGYKGYGANVADRQGNLDRNEFYNISKDDIFGLSEKWPAPELLDNNRDVTRAFMTDAHSVVTFVLKTLNDYLGLPPNTLQNKHRLEGASGDQVRFIKAPPQPMDDRKIALGEHTDFGSVTVLFNRLGGLQVLPPGKGAEWCYVRPIENHAIVNLGDAMAKFTNGLLRSNIHRVISPPGEQASTTRFSLVYFSRPENEVFMKRLDGSEKIPALPEGVTEDDVMAKDWIIRRALGHRHAINGKEAFNWDNIRGTEDLSRRDK